MRQRRTFDSSQMTDRQRASFAEHLKERIYATLTLLAVMVVLWQHPEDHTPLGTIGIILGSVVSLWLATAVASRMASHIINSDGTGDHKHYENLQAASGLLAPAAAPNFFVLLSLLGFINLQTALLIGMISLVLSLFLFSIMAGRKTSDTLLHVVGYSLLQMALGVGVIALKLVTE